MTYLEFAKGHQAGGVGRIAVLALREGHGICLTNNQDCSQEFRVGCKSFRVNTAENAGSNSPRVLIFIYM